MEKQRVADEAELDGAALSTAATSEGEGEREHKNMRKSGHKTKVDLQKKVDGLAGQLKQVATLPVATQRADSMGKQQNGHTK